METIQCSETSAYKIQTPGNYPEDNILLLGFGFTGPSSLLSLQTVPCMLQND
jgi:hypothetical protein